MSTHKRYIFNIKGAMSAGYMDALIQEAAEHIARQLDNGEPFFLNVTDTKNPIADYASEDENDD